MHGDDASLTARLLFADPTTAAADLEARATYFEAGPLGDDDAPLESYGSYEMSREGPVVDIELDDMGSDTVSRLVEDEQHPRLLRGTRGCRGSRGGRAE